MNKFTIILESDETKLSPEQIIQKAWQEYIDKNNTYEFYHLMRSEGYDGDIILNSINI